MNQVQLVLLVFQYCDTKGTAKFAPQKNVP